MPLRLDNSNSLENYLKYVGSCRQLGDIVFPLFIRGQLGVSSERCFIPKASDNGRHSKAFGILAMNVSVGNVKYILTSNSTKVTRGGSSGPGGCPKHPKHKHTAWQRRYGS